MSKTHRILPGFHLTLGLTLFYLSLLVILPLLMCFLKASTLSWEEFKAVVWTKRAVAAYWFTLRSAFLGSIASMTIGSLIAWVLIRYDFWGKQIMDSLIDLPFALPTSVAGLIYSSLYVDKGWLGRYLAPLGIHGAYSSLGVVLVLTFIGLPFIVRTLQPVLESLELDVEEAAFLLGASRRQTILKVLVPQLVPALITGFALSLARGIGEYGSVIFISGNMPMRTEIAPSLILERLDSFAYAEATAIAVVLLVISFVLLVLTNVLERWSARYAN